MFRELMFTYQGLIYLAYMTCVFSVKKKDIYIYINKM